MWKRRKRFVVWLTPNSGLKLALSVLLMALLVFIYTYELPATRTWSEWTLPLSGKTIALDAGHGGPDGGAKNSEGVIEKDINLAITLHLRDYLQQSGAIVIMTREEDKDLASKDTKGYSRRKTEDLMKRADFVSAMKSNLFISVHLNSIPSNRWRGAQTFYSSNHMDNANLAGLIQSELVRNLENTDRIAKPADRPIYLLKVLKMPSALVEVGFLSNPDEGRLLTSEAYQKKVAASIYQGILRYYAGEKLGTN
ncbi:N-acetylmuramoyl-L-alanine amidase CwlD [Paenibacillus eucommiae]|uniref:N-acetylmuramoyl-L-alanine amidase n=1 Tax=Paenibacillus eucommiae TaxID=1355755 RepID=A0ABS4J965_9BACL|nr:N-acetylmuramoyl-L-alanine amidase CwlD [Paenibacillus eucommiae]MBP1996393.1 N-acetylmuramoyl-L-alanine amidase [Paenibacillus eucommiae]